ncbi:MAG TPA: aminotransferase, partial [Treponemataceae bacterium]|nr:aminotransferase [Treponemataceae bacterium]
MLHFLAQELNEILQDSPVDSFLSALGRRLYFPKGIIAQSAEAKQQGKKANATVGITVNDGKPAILPCIQKHFPYLNSS